MVEERFEEQRLTQSILGVVQGPRFALIFSGLALVVATLLSCASGSLAFAASTSSSSSQSEDSDESRYTVLVLDVSGPETFVFGDYLSGTSILRIGGPDEYTADSSIEEVKASAAKFVDDSKYSINSNKIAVVAYASEASVVCDFTDDRSKLKKAINELQEVSEGEGGSDRNISAGLDCASELLAAVHDDGTIKNVLLCTTGLTDTGEHDYEGWYDENVTGSAWQNMETEIRLYAYSNIAIESADRIKETGTTIYVMGIFEPVESGMPSEGQDVASFLRIVARDLASSDGTFTAVENPEEIDFVFGELQADLAGSALTRIYNDANYSEEHALVEEGADSDMQGSYYEEMLWGPDLFDTPATRIHLQPINSSDSPNYNLAMVCASLSATAYNDYYLRHAYETLGFDDDDIFLYSYPSSDLNRENAMLNGEKFASDETFGFSIASREMVFNNASVGDLVIISLCGTNDLTELAKDKFAKANRDFYGYTAYDAICDFRDEVFAGLEDYYLEHEELGERPLKFLVTGHSLGGAGANLVAAQLNLEAEGDAWFSKNVTADDIYAYTFGAIDSISKGQWRYDPDNSFATDDDADAPQRLVPSNSLDSTDGVERIDVTLPVAKGFENIANVYNYLDTFGPNWKGFDHLGITAPAGNSMYGKFGVFFTFSEGNMSGLVDSGSVWPTHEMAGYLAALRLGWPSADAKTDYVRVSIRCPVDINVYRNGELVLSVVDEEIDVEDSSVKCAVEDGAKTMVLPKGENFNIEIIATDSGTMQYNVADLDINDQSGITYTDVSLDDGKRLDSDINSGVSADAVELFVLGDNGERIARVETDGLETDIEEPPIETIDGASSPSFRFIPLACGAVVVVIAGVLAAVVIRKRHRAVAARQSGAVSEWPVDEAIATYQGERQSIGDVACECGAINPREANYCKSCGRVLRR